MNWSTVIAAGTCLAAFALFFPALVRQFRPGDCLPRWVPSTLRRRPENALARAGAIAWTAIWSIGGQAVVVYLAAIEIGRAQMIESAALALELLLAGVLALSVLRRSKAGA